MAEGRQEKGGWIGFFLCMNPHSILNRSPVRRQCADGGTEAWEAGPGSVIPIVTPGRS
jgi:hypothetical protein